jgi:hypothetical protein
VFPIAVSNSVLEVLMVGLPPYVPPSFEARVVHIFFVTSQDLERPRGYLDDLPTPCRQRLKQDRDRSGIAHEAQAL